MEPVERITSYLRLFIQPGQVTELRAFGDQIYAGWYDGEHLPAMAQAAVELERKGTRGIYFIPNPVNPELLARSPNRVQIAGKTTTDADITARRWLLVDVDPVRPADTSASETERQHAWQVANHVQACLEAAGFQAPVIASSGNGWHLSYLVDHANDAAQREQFRAILHGLDRRCSSEHARVDVRTYNAARIWKLYGTTSRKGRATDERPHRLSWVADGRPDGAAQGVNTAACGVLLDSWARQDRLLLSMEGSRQEPELAGRARAYLRQIAPAVSGQNGHGHTYHAAMTLVEGFGLDRETALQLLGEWNTTCQPPWSPRELEHKVDDATRHIRDKGHLARQPGSTSQATGKTKAVYTGPDCVPEPEQPDDPIATADDLVQLQATITWTWPGWIQRGTLTCLASDPGIGKTRLCADITRRIWHGLEWPDGKAATMPLESRVLWVAADSQWAELGTLPGAFGFPGRAIVLNGRRSNPYSGTNLDSLEDLATLERNIRAVQPALVFVDTIGNATDRNQGRAEEAKALFKPLAEIATRTSTSIILVTHLNRGGQVMGNRIIGAVRQVIMLDQPEGAEENRRRLRVSKTNSQKPPALGISMGPAGNTYDIDPPVPPEEQPATKGRGRPSHLEEDRKWVEERLAFGAKRVSALIQEGEACGLTMHRLYAVMRRGYCEEFLADGRKFWKMPELPAQAGQGPQGVPGPPAAGR